MDLNRGKVKGRREINRQVSIKAKKILNWLNL
jgi:hypothetical protein